MGEWTERDRIVIELFLPDLRVACVSLRIPPSRRWEGLFYCKFPKQFPAPPLVSAVVKSRAHEICSKSARAAHSQLGTADDKLMYSLRAPKDVTLDTNPSLRILAGC